MTHALSTLADYQSWITSIKQRVQSARLRAALAANSEFITLYYELGAQIVERETHAQWGSSFIESFSKDLRQSIHDAGCFTKEPALLPCDFSTFTAMRQYGNKPLPYWLIYPESVQMMNVSKTNRAKFFKWLCSLENG